MVEQRDTRAEPLPKPIDSHLSLECSILAAIGDHDREAGQQPVSDQTAKSRYGKEKMQSKHARGLSQERGVLEVPDLDRAPVG